MSYTDTLRSDRIERQIGTNDSVIHPMRIFNDTVNIMPRGTIIKKRSVLDSFILGHKTLGDLGVSGTLFWDGFDAAALTADWTVDGAAGAAYSLASSIASSSTDRIAYAYYDTGKFKNGIVYSKMMSFHTNQDAGLLLRLQSADNAAYGFFLDNSGTIYKGNPKTGSWTLISSATGLVDTVNSFTHFYGFKGNANDTIGTSHGSPSWTPLTNDRFSSPNSAYQFNNRQVTGEAVAYYPFVDSSLNSVVGAVQTFTASGAIATTDQFGASNHAYYFDGSNDDISADSATFDISGASALTMACWVYITALPAVSSCPLGIHERGNEAVSDKCFEIAADGTVSWWVWDGANVQIASTAAGAVAAGSWYHICGTYDGTNVKVYVNSIIGATTDTSASTYNFTNPVLQVSLVRGDAYSTNHFYGKVDDVFFDDAALSQAQVTALYTYSVYNHIVIPYTALDGLDDFSLFMWINTTDTCTDSWMLSSVIAGGTNDCHLGLISATQLRAWIKGDVQSDAFTAINDGTWHHVGFTRSGTVATFYLDGVQTGATKACSTVALAPVNIVIGQEQDLAGGGFQVAQAYVGKIGNIAIFNTVLSAADVLILYNQPNEFQDVIFVANGSNLYGFIDGKLAAWATDTTTSTEGYSGVLNTRGTISGTCRADFQDFDMCSVIFADEFFGSSLSSSWTATTGSFTVTGGYAQGASAV